MLEKQIRKKFKITKVGLAIFDVNLNQVIPFKIIELKGHLSVKEINKEVKELFPEVINLGISDHSHLTKFYELSETDFMKYGKEISEQESKYYYVKKSK